MTDASAEDMAETIDTDQCAIHRNATTDVVKTKNSLTMPVRTDCLDPSMFSDGVHKGG
jgi:hypothetical protein